MNLTATGGRGRRRLLVEAGGGLLVRPGGGRTGAEGEVERVERAPIVSFTPLNLSIIVFFFYRYDAAVINTFL
jgi:hypothetical protein